MSDGSKPTVVQTDWRGLRGLVAGVLSHHAPGATPKAEATWVWPDWLPVTPDDWGAWIDEAGEWRSKALDGTARIDILDPYERDGEVHTWIRIEANGRQIWEDATSANFRTKVRQALAFVGLDFEVPEVPVNAVVPDDMEGP